VVVDRNKQVRLRLSDRAFCDLSYCIDVQQALAALLHARQQWVQQGRQLEGPQEQPDPQGAAAFEGPAVAGSGGGLDEAAYQDGWQQQQQQQQRQDGVEGGSNGSLARSMSCTSIGSSSSSGGGRSAVAAPAAAVTRGSHGIFGLLSLGRLGRAQQQQDEEQQQQQQQADSIAGYDAGTADAAEVPAAAAAAAAVVADQQQQQHSSRAIDSMFGSDNRMGVPGSLHRISAMRNRQGAIDGLTYRWERLLVQLHDMRTAHDSCLRVSYSGSGCGVCG
jgi:hypothetical protein